MKNGKQEKENPNQKIKRYFLSKEEKEKIQNIQSVMGILALQKEGLNNSMYMEIALIKRRLNLHTPESQIAPEGFTRVIDFDPNSFELLVVDRKIEKKEEKVGPVPPEAKN